MAENFLKPDARGGARVGAGRKPGAFSVARMQELMDEVRAREKLEGRSLLSILLDEAFSKKATRLAAARYILDKTTVAVTEGGESDRELGPAFYLPEKRPQIVAVKDEQSEKTEAA